MNIENFLKKIKKRKSPITIEITNSEESIFTKILNDELIYYRNNYTRLSKLTISEKTKIREKKRKIEDLRNEIEQQQKLNTFIPKQVMNLSENDIEKNINLNLISNDININENRNGSVTSKNINFCNSKSNNSDFVNCKNEESALIKLNTSIDINNEEMYNKMSIELTNNKETIKKLYKEVNDIKADNSKIESEISNLNNQLSNKFCFIYKLEKKLDKMKNKIKIERDINENVNVEKIHKIVSLPISTKLNLHNTSDFLNPKKLQTIVDKSKIKDIND